MRKVILFILVLTVSLFSQQLNYTFGVDAQGDALSGSFTNLDSTGATSYDIYVDLNDYYPYDVNPVALGDSSDDVVGSSDVAVLATVYYYFDVDAATDSVVGDWDASSGVYSTSNLTMAATLFDATPVKQADVSGANDIFGHINIYTESGKLFPPEVIKITFDVDPAAAEVSTGVDLYYRVVYPQIYKVHEERK
jgi:hypothetical protein